MLLVDLEGEVEVVAALEALVVVVVVDVDLEVLVVDLEVGAAEAGVVTGGREDGLGFGVLEVFHSLEDLD